MPLFNFMHLGRRAFLHLPRTFSELIGLNSELIHLLIIIDSQPLIHPLAGMIRHSDRIDAGVQKSVGAVVASRKASKS